MSFFLLTRCRFVRYSKIMSVAFLMLLLYGFFWRWFFRNEIRELKQKGWLK
jgi:hypothetical protein